FKPRWDYQETDRPRLFRPRPRSVQLDLLELRDVGEVFVEAEDMNAVEPAAVVEPQRLGLLPSFVEAGPVEGPRPKVERVVGVLLLREMAESHVGHVRLLGPQEGLEDA